MKTLLTFLLCLTVFSGAALTPSGTMPLDGFALKARAAGYARHDDPYNAISAYEQYFAGHPGHDLKAAWRLALLYFSVRDYAHALQYFDTLSAAKKRKYVHSEYYRGIISMNLGKYDEAVRSFTAFRNSFRKKKDPENYRKLALTYIESATWAKTAQKQDDGIVVSHPGSTLNHPDIDFSPFILNENTLLFGTKEHETHGRLNSARQIYVARKVDNRWMILGEAEDINDPDENTANAAVTEDGTEIILTRTEMNWKNRIVSSIYHAYRDSNRWQTPEKLPWPINDANYTATQPTIAANPKNGNRVLYFVSDRPGGRGGLDIWYSEFNRRTHTWSIPANAGRDINSPADECSPFYDNASHILYFSSKGKTKGYGGYDIYKASGSAKKWVDVIPMPKPVNSSYDDYYFSIRSDNRHGFFTSNRPGTLTLGNGGCCDDIFEFDIRECSKVKAIGTVRNEMNYGFFDELTRKYPVKLTITEKNTVLPDITVELYQMSDSAAGTLLVTRSVTDENGIYSFELDKNKQYEVLVKNFGYFEKRIPVSTDGVNCADTVHVGTTSITYLPGASIAVNIYYPHNRFNLSDSAMLTIDRTILPLFDLFPGAILEIGSHTDNTGTDAYNLRLSQRRSESVVRYLAEKGIPAERMVAMGYGMRAPVAFNTLSDGTDNPAGRQLNRRTEIRIVGEINNTKLPE